MDVQKYQTRMHGQRRLAVSPLPPSLAASHFPDEPNYLLSLLTPRRLFPHLYRHAIISGEHHIPFLYQRFLFGITEEHILCLCLSPTVIVCSSEAHHDEMCLYCVQE